MGALLGGLLRKELQCGKQRNAPRETGRELLDIFCEIILVQILIEILHIIIVVPPTSFWISAYPDTIIAHSSIKTITRLERNFLTMVESQFCFPDACVRWKHSAWMSIAPNRADARTHSPQRKTGKQRLPLGGSWRRRRLREIALQ